MIANADDRVEHLVGVCARELVIAARAHRPRQVTQRAAQEVRSIFAHNGGNLASTGAVAFQFLHAGQFLIAKEKTTEDALMEIVLDAGADDVITTAEGFEVRCSIHAFDKVAHALDQKNVKPDSAEIAYIPTITVPVADVSAR